jgi:hypothetical protein
MTLYRGKNGLFPDLDAILLSIIVLLTSTVAGNNENQIIFSQALRFYYS